VNPILLTLALAVAPVQAPSQTQSDPVFRATLVAFMVTQGTDLYYTGRCLEAQTCREGNPALRWAEDSAALPVLKMAVAGTAVAVLARVRDKSKPFYRDPAWYTAVGLTGLYVWISKRNYDLYQEARR
jgi:hypothetical protein